MILWPLRALLVHKDAKGDVAVVAVMFDVGTENAELNTLWTVMPEKAEQNINVTLSSNPQKTLRSCSEMRA